MPLIEPENHTFSLDSAPAHLPHAHIASLDGLQQDMLSALEYDQRKQQVNDAKLRAVKQRVEYDDFANLVAGAHLKPIKPKSNDLAAISNAFDGFVMPKVEPAKAGPGVLPLPARVGAAGASAASDAVPPAPKTSNEFTNAWRRQCKTSAQRCAYLRQLDAETLPLLFRTELDAAIFDGIVSTLGEVELATAEDRAWAADLLQGVARINRFELTLDFAEAAGLKTLAKLLDSWAELGELDAATLSSVRLAYKLG